MSLLADGGRQAVEAVDAVDELLEETVGGFEGGEGWGRLGVVAFEDDEVGFA